MTKTEALLFLFPSNIGLPLQKWIFYSTNAYLENNQNRKINMFEILR